MRMLAIECATEACSLALFEGETLLAASHNVLGRGHAEHLVPLISQLPDRGRADEIRVSLGPGSFTGVRIGLAAARALAFAWHADVHGFPTLALVAATALQSNAEPVSVCMSGGHGEWFVQNFDAVGSPEAAARSITPDIAAATQVHWIIAGNRARESASMRSEEHLVLDVLPDARFVRKIPQNLLRNDLSPIYGRGPDARLPS